jgi:small subunit ribosomal protein S4e
MTKNHLKRITAPKTWHVQRKKTKFIARPSPGGTPLKYTMPLSVLLLEQLKLFQTRKEVKNALNNKDILVNGTPRNDYNFPIGLFDVLSLPKMEKAYRLAVNKNEKLILLPLEKKHANERVCKITKKITIPGKKIQISTFDGRTLVLAKDDQYKVGDSILVHVPEQKIEEHLKLEKGATAYVFRGKSCGETVTIEAIEGSVIHYTKKDEKKETRKEFCIIIGKNMPELSHVQ